ncbi:MAG: DUF2089 family protein [Candidatus Cloacimonadales bacterium]|nr:DUF2089 family protein [Candidatus Cloacimonadales bacterium]
MKRWIISTAGNYCKKYFAKSSKETKNTEKYGSEIFKNLMENPIVESDLELSKAFKESFNALTEVELQTILYYFKCNENFKEIHENLDISYDALRKRLSRIKSKLKAETYKKLGYYGSKRIVTPQLNNLIIKFLQRFKENLENGTINKMYYYFSDVDLSNYEHNIKIKKIIEYDIELLNSVYKAWVFYENKQDIAESFFIEFYIDENNYLRIITPPTKKSNLIVFDADSMEAKKIIELLKKYPEDKTGRPNVPKEEIDQIIQQYKEKQKEK